MQGRCSQRPEAAIKDHLAVYDNSRKLPATPLQSEGYAIGALCLPAQRKAANLFAKRRERYSDRSRRLGEQAPCRHARKGICLKTPKISRYIHSEVDATVIS